MTTPAQRRTRRRDPVLARFLVGFEGHALPSELAHYLDRGLAGIVLYPRNFQSLEQLRNLTGAIRRAAGRPVLIGVDQEGGTRFALKQPFTAWPSAAELGRLGDVEQTSQVARAMGLELRAAGCNLDFAPMLDLHVHPESPVTKDRSFGGDPHQVARLGVAFHQGLREAGVLSCAKHFPGHGDTLADPHLDLPVFTGDIKRLDSAELVPFAAAVAGGVPAVMTAHILLPRIDAERPASFSRKILDGILRRRLGFQGLILADDLGMGAIARRYGPGEAAVQALLAGTDIVMLCHDWTAVSPAMDAVRLAHETKKFEEAEWRASLERVRGIGRICARAEFSLSQPPPETIGCAQYGALAKQIRVQLDKDSG